MKAHELKIKLKDIVGELEIIEQEFEYAGVQGIAELLNWNIVFFYKKNDPINVVAISFLGIDNIDLINISNKILSSINFEVKFGDSIEVINQSYGKEDFTDDLYGDMIRYNYIISKKLLLIFGLEDNMLSYLEIITDEKMIKEIISVRKNN